jgi:tetratricopeptide (TPR) repeat protein
MDEIIFESNKKLIENEPNNLIAWMMLGHHYENGIGTKQDYSKAIECYKKGEERKNINCLFNLGMLYKKLNEHQLAKKYLKFVADHNYGVLEKSDVNKNCQVKAQINYGIYLLEEKNFEESEKYFLFASVHPKEFGKLI